MAGGIYCRIDGIDLSFLEWLGYGCVFESEEFWIFRDYHGEEYIVFKKSPYLKVEDINDAALINEKSMSKGAVAVPR